MHDYFWVTKSTTKITSVLIWFCTCCKSGFILSLRAWTPILANLALSPLAILQACCHWRLLVLAPVMPPSSLYQPYLVPQLLPWVCFVPHAIYYQQWWSTFSGTISTNTSNIRAHKIAYIFIVKFLCRNLFKINLLKGIGLLYFLIKDYHL